MYPAQQGGGGGPPVGGPPFGAPPMGGMGGTSSAPGFPGAPMNPGMNPPRGPPPMAGNGVPMGSTMSGSSPMPRPGGAPPTMQPRPTGPPPGPGGSSSSQPGPAHNHQAPMGSYMGAPGGKIPICIELHAGIPRPSDSLGFQYFPRISGVSEPRK